VLVEPLFQGPIDIIGDIHGELAPLTALLVALGYSEHGDHPEGRRLVFVGDLVDRGPESASVVELVAELVAKGRAQCILGNHELNILRHDNKPDNDWFFTGTSPTTQSNILEFLDGLALALERQGLRIVHACWHDESIAMARAYSGNAIDCFREAERRVKDALEEEGIAEKAAHEEAQHLLRDFDNPPSSTLPNFAASECRQQMENPVKVLTSGIERIADEHFWSNGKWRYTHRVPWWNEYVYDTEVVVGHYWRSRDKSQPFVDEPGLFGDAGPTDRLGPAKQVMCVDYSIGWRSKERARSSGDRPFRTALAAYRVSEGEPPELVFSPG